MNSQQQPYPTNGQQQPNSRKYPAKNTAQKQQEEAGLSNYLFGKVQPQAISLEEAVLGALMLDREVLPMIMDILRPESFYLESHQHIYRAIMRLFERSNPVDLLTVTEEMRQTGTLDKAGNGYYLVELSHRVASAANVEYHARIIAQKHIQRELIKVSTAIIRDAYEDTTDVFTLLDDAERKMFNITMNNMSRQYEALSSLNTKALKEIEARFLRKEGLTGVPTGFTDLDRITCGFQPSDLIIIAARPGMGKTGMVLSLALNAARDFGKPVAIFSLEMASTQLVQRLISMDASISSAKLRSGKLHKDEWRQLQETVERLNTVPIFIDDTPAINIYELRAKCRRLKQQHDIQMVIIDYIQLMTGAQDNRNGNREQEIAGISRALKALAKELNVPVIALAQLSRAVEVRGGMKRPQLSDLRESGSLEQDCDIVSFIYRPEYYQILEDENGQSLKGIAEIIIAKHRNGALDTVKLKFTDTYARFSNLDDPDFAENLALLYHGVANVLTESVSSSPNPPASFTFPSRINEEDIPF